MFCSTFIAAAREFFYFCAVTQLLSGLIIVMASILRGLRDANAVLWMVMIGYWGVGLLGQISPVSRLVLSLSGLVGHTVGSEINGNAVTGGFPIVPFNASLGNSAIYKVETSADFAFTPTIHGNVGVEYTHFRYGESAPFVFTAGGNTAIEPDGRTSNVTVRVGLGIAFGGDRDCCAPLK